MSAIDVLKLKMTSTRKSKIILSLSLTGWLLAASTGLGLVVKYGNTAGSSGTTPTEWPAESLLRRTPGLPTLVMMIHPHCPCSRASISELALLMTHGYGRVNADVVFVKPAGFTEEWENTDLWSGAGMIPGVRIRVDTDRVEARRFGSQTSGQIMLYSADGQLLFSGGITAARGHSGDNDGRSAIVSLLNNGAAQKRETPVFGCPLFEEASNDETKDSCHAIHSN